VYCGAAFGSPQSHTGHWATISSNWPRVPPICKRLASVAVLLERIAFAGYAHGYNSGMQTGMTPIERDHS